MTVQESLMRFLDHTDAQETDMLLEDGSHMDIDQGKALYKLQGNFDGSAYFDNRIAINSSFFR
jgi:hypothetical protein